VLALAHNRRLVRLKSVGEPALAGFAELEVLLLVGVSHVVDDELLAAVVAVVEDGRHVLVQELVQIEAHQDGEGGCEFLRVLHANI